MLVSDLKGDGGRGPSWVDQERHAAVAAFKVCTVMSRLLILSDGICNRFEIIKLFTDLKFLLLLKLYQTFLTCYIRSVDIFTLKVLDTHSHYKWQKDQI